VKQLLLVIAFGARYRFCVITYRCALRSITVLLFAQRGKLLASKLRSCTSTDRKRPIVMERNLCR
jgi:hypothetical protein